MTKTTQTSQRIDSTSLTVLTAFERLLEKAQGSNLSKEFFRKAKPLTDFLNAKLGVTAVQAVMLAVILNADRDEYVPLSRLSRTLGCNTIHLLSMLGELDDLECRRYLTCNRRCDDNGYRVPNIVLDAFKRNEHYTPEPITGLDPESLMEYFDTLVDQRDDNDISFERYVKELRELIDANPQLTICKGLKNLDLNDEALALLVFFIQRLVSADDDNILMGQFSDVLEGPRLKRARKTFVQRQHPLVTAQIVEPTRNEGLFDGNGWRLTNQFCHEILAEYNIVRTEEQEVNDASLLKAEDIHATPLFYNAEEERQVKRLAQLLEPTHFADIHKRLTDKGMRTGFNCIFYGAPGTGKTETALQLARLTGRDIMQVDIPQIKSMWVGETEKNIKAIFDRYHHLVEHRKVAPILLFNEADAVFGNRIEGVQRSVDKMENTMQNIILQEMETLDGILIATTNLTVNLDQAFERRFLYKIKFEQPTVEVRSRIWRLKLQDLNEAQASELAETYNFSGGQIENIARKRVVDDILSGRDGVDMDVLHDYCRCELLNKGSQTTYAGFKTA